VTPHFAPQAPSSVLDLFDRLPDPPPADSVAGHPPVPTESAVAPEINGPHANRASPPPDREPSELGWEAYAEWRPPCFGRLALEYATCFGLHVMPLLVEGCQPVYRAVPRGSADASRDAATIHAWWTRAPRANVGIACELSGLLVLEVNPHGGGPETLAMHAERLGPLPPTWTARTPGGWTQYFFSHADGDASALPELRELGPGVEVTHRGHVLAPPSLIEGCRSAWHLDGRPGRVPLAAMPAPWMDRLTGRKLPPHVLSGLDARHSILGCVFAALGWLGRMLEDGRRIARCPWAREHTWPGGAGGDTATILYSPESAPWFGRFACQHPECAGRGHEDLLDLLPQESLEAAYAALPDHARGAAVVLDGELALKVEHVRDAARLLDATLDPLPRSGPTPANDSGRKRGAPEDL
jgi:Bifunctional DNA primase/polymerase, N-terminal